MNSNSATLIKQQHVDCSLVVCDTVPIWRWIPLNRSEASIFRSQFGDHKPNRHLQKKLQILKIYICYQSVGMPVPVAARSRAWVWGRSPAETVGSNPTRGMDVCLLWVVCCQVEVSATSSSLVQRSPTECGASLCDIETSWMRRPWPTVGCRVKRK